MCCFWPAREPIHTGRQMQARACAPASRDPPEVNMQTQAPAEHRYLAPEAMLFGGLSYGEVVTVRTLYALEYESEWVCVCITL